MRATIFILLVQVVCATGFTQSLSFKFGTPFRRTDLNVRWNAPSNSYPAEVRVYRLLPRSFPASAISYLTSLGPFSNAELVRSNANEVLFKKSDGITSLWVSSQLGEVELQKRNPYGPKNLATNIPALSEIPVLTTNFLKELGINIVDVEKKPDGLPNFNCWEPFTEYFANHTFITNIEFRAVGFRRSVNGARWVGAGTGGSCDVHFGELGKPSQISLSWRNLEDYRSYKTVNPETIIRWIRQGKAVQNMIAGNLPPIDWKSVKDVVVTKAMICYYAGGPFEPSDWLIPFVALWAQVHSEGQGWEVEIDCPIYDPKKPLP